MSTGYYPDSYNSQNTTIIVRDYVTEIPAGAFNSEYEYEFNSFANLESVLFESDTNLLTIGDYAFSQISGGGDGLSMTLPSSVTAIGKLFCSGTYLNNIIIKNCKITTIPIHAFHGSNLVDANFNLTDFLPKTVRIIDDSSFVACDSGSFPTTISFPNGITYIGKNVFRINPDSQTTYYIPKTVTYLGTGVFTNPLSIINLSSRVNVNPSLYPNAIVFNAPVCFLVNTKILTMQSNGKEKYVQIQHLCKGDLVKTSENGYKKIDVIGYSTIDHRIDNQLKKNKLYVCSQNKYPELFEDLVITGCHSILVNRLTDKQRAETIEMAERVFVTENHYRLFACLDEKAKVYPKNGEYEIWHFALENEDEKGNYGVYANGLLVESSSKRMMHEYSGMQLV